MAALQDIDQSAARPHRVVNTPVPFGVNTPVPFGEVVRVLRRLSRVPLESEVARAR